MDQEVVQALFSAFIVVAAMLLVGFPIHEALHAWTAMKLGDNTARDQGIGSASRSITRQSTPS